MFFEMFLTYWLATSQESVRRKLAEQEAEEIARGVAYVMHEAVSASQLIVMGLDLESQQYVLSSCNQGHPILKTLVLADAV